MKDTLDTLAQQWAAAKDNEDHFRNQRVAIEEAITKIHPARAEGSETFSTPGGARITLTGKVSYKADVDALTALTGSWPADVRPLKTKVEADETKLKAIRHERPDLWLKIAPAIETKDAKVGVKVTLP